MVVNMKDMGNGIIFKMSLKNWRMENNVSYRVRAGGSLEGYPRAGRLFTRNVKTNNNRRNTEIFQTEKPEGFVISWRLLKSLIGSHVSVPSWGHGSSVTRTQIFSA
jgi:hypothetical protein